MLIYISITYRLICVYCVFVYQFKCVITNLTENSIAPIDIPQNMVNYTNSVEDKQKIQKNISNVINYVNHVQSKENQMFNWPVLRMRNIIKKSTQIQNEFKVKNEETEYSKTSGSAAKTSVWDFGGTWSSELAGVRFEMDAHSTVGMDKNMPVKILDRVDGTKSNGFLNKGWMAKANAQYGRSGPVTLFAINRPEKTVAVFVGFVHTQDNKEFVTGMWSMGKNCKNNLDFHQSVFNIPDVLLKEGI